MAIAFANEREEIAFEMFKSLLAMPNANYEKKYNDDEYAVNCAYEMADTFIEVRQRIRERRAPEPEAKPAAWDHVIFNGLLDDLLHNDRARAAAVRRHDVKQEDRYRTETQVCRQRLFYFVDRSVGGVRATPPLEQAVGILIDELKRDPDYWRSWRDNIAMAIADTTHTFDLTDRQWRNKCAETFLARLCQ